MTPICAACLLSAGLLAATLAESQSAWRKLARIADENVAPPSRTDFTPGELNAWIRDEASVRVPRGVSNLRLELATGRATGYADVDFLNLRQAVTGEAPGWLMKNLFAGRRPVVVTARFQSRNGRARVDVERVEISGVPIEGRMLDFVIDDYLRPTFPDVKVAEWFDLRYKIDRFTVNPRGVSVFIGRPGSK